MERVCPVCKQNYEDGGDSWKSKCYDCYKNFRTANRIQSMKSYGGRHNEFYLTHPSVTKEELETWIKKNDLPRGWGPQPFNEAAPGWKKFTIWLDNTNFD
jgi:protein-arginine kinase activator protein McsA